MTTPECKYEDDYCKLNMQDMMARQQLIAEGKIRDSKAFVSQSRRVPRFDNEESKHVGCAAYKRQTMTSREEKDSLDLLVGNSDNLEESDDDGEDFTAKLGLSLRLKHSAVLQRDPPSLLCARKCAICFETFSAKSTAAYCGKCKLHLTSCKTRTLFKPRGNVGLKANAMQERNTYPETTNKKELKRLKQRRLKKAVRRGRHLTRKLMRKFKIGAEATPPKCILCHPDLANTTARKGLDAIVSICLRHVT